MRSSSAVLGAVAERGPSDRTSTRLRRLATVAAIVALAETIVSIRLSASGDPRFRFDLDFATLGFLANITLFPVVGALIVQRRPTTKVAWLMILTGLGWATGIFLDGYGATGMPPAELRPGALEAVVVSRAFFVPSIACGAALLLLFPTDRLLGPRWVLVAVAALVGAGMFDVGLLLRPGPLDPGRFPGVQNPIAAPAEWARLVEAVAVLGNVLVTAALVLGTISLVIRYRRADRVEAAQIRWIALVGATSAVAFTISSLPITESQVAFDFGILVLGSMPIAIGVAVTRYRLYDIDRLINRALVYGSLTAILAGAFTAAIGLAQRVFVAVTGEKSDAAIVLTTLVVATLYAPLRKRLELVVDRYFKYDERRFGAYRDEVTRMLAILEPGRAAERLAAQTVRELRAIGAAVVDSQSKPLASAGEWPVPTVARLAIPGGANAGLGAILVGARSDGELHDPRAIADLEELAGLVAKAVRPASTIAARGATDDLPA